MNNYKDKTNKSFQFTSLFIYDVYTRMLILCTCRCFVAKMDSYLGSNRWICDLWTQVYGFKSSSVSFTWTCLCLPNMGWLARSGRWCPTILSRAPYHPPTQTRLLAAERKIQQNAKQPLWGSSWSETCAFMYSTIICSLAWDHDDDDIYTKLEQDAGWDQ